MANLNIIATLSQYPYQGIQTLVDKVYLYNPLEINNLIVQLNELIEKLGGMTGVDYKGLDNKPVLNTKNKTSLPTLEDETIVDTIMLHEVSKTGDYKSLLNLPPLGKLSAKDQIKDVDVADDAAIARSKLASDVVASLDLADTAVQTADYNVKMESLDTAINALNSGLQAESAARANADTILQGNIDSEASARASEDVKLAADIAKNATAISDEATARNQADAALQDNITKEATTRSNADKALQNGIDAEATARTDADNALQASITKNAGDITTLRNDVDGLGDQVSDIEGKIPGNASTSNQLATKADVSGLETSLAKVAKTGLYSDLNDKPTIGNAVLTITRNNESAGSFTANATENKTINITVPVSAGDVNALPDSTKYGASFSLTMDSTTYKVSALLKDQNGDALGAVQTIDLPLESVVVSGTYDATTKEVVLTLQDGSEIRFSVADLVDGLQTEITEANKLSADLVDDSTTVNKFVTATEKATWSGKQDAISDLETIRDGASKGATAVQPAAIADMETKTNAAATYQPKGDYATNATTDTLRNDIDGLGDQVHEIEAKIPSDATASNQLATKADLANVDTLPAQTGNAGKVLSTDGANAFWDTVQDNNGLEGDYCCKYGIVDETKSGLPYQGTGNQVIIPAQLQLDMYGTAGLTTITGNVTVDLTVTTNCELWLESGSGTVYQATRTYWQEKEPAESSEPCEVWISSAGIQVKSNDTGNVFRKTNVTRVVKCILTGGSLTRLSFTGCRVLNKQLYATKADVAAVNAELAKKQDTLVSGTNIKTVNGETLLGPGNIEVVSGGAVPVGTIFTTPRTGTIPGAVGANGGSYNIADYSGEGSIGALLAAGSIAYVSKTEFQTQVTNTGTCDSFGWNGIAGALYAWSPAPDDPAGNPTVYTQTQAPSVGENVYYNGGAVAGTIATINNNIITVEGDAPGEFARDSANDVAGTPDPTFLVPHIRDLERVPNWSVPTKISAFPYTAPQDGWTVINITRNANSYDKGFVQINGENVAAILPVPNYSFGDGNVQVPVKAGDIVNLSGNVDAKYIANFYPYNIKPGSLRYMVQLATGATDQALETCTGVLSDVSALNAHRVVEFQVPTEANGYTWARKYADGWVEQGGSEILTGVKEKQITFPVVMRDGHYTPSVTAGWSSAASGQLEGCENLQTTGMRLTASYEGVTLWWQVSGMAA